MALIRVRSVSPPLDRPALAGPAVRLVRHADAVGLLPRDEAVDRLDMTLVRRIAAEASAAGIGQDAAIGLLGRPGTDARLASLMTSLDAAMAASPLPERELAELSSVFDLDTLARLAGSSAVSLRRYLSGARRAPDALAERLHWLALVVGDLRGAYNDVGVRRWFERTRSALDGRAPRAIVTGDWDPSDPDVERVRELASSLAGVGAAT
jgi:hypothetical protein